MQYLPLGSVSFYFTSFIYPMKTTCSTRVQIWLVHHLRSIDPSKHLSVLLFLNNLTNIELETHTYVNFRSTLDVCMCMYACTLGTLGANLTLSTLMSDFFHMGRMDFPCFMC